MKLLDRYLISRLTVLFIFAILVFTIAWIAPEILFNAIQGVSQGKLTLAQGFDYLVYQVPTVLVYCIPISTLFASVFLFRQLSLSSELTSILTSGVPFARVLLPIGLVGLGISVFFYITQDCFVPWASSSLHQLTITTHFDDHNNINPQVTFVEKSPSGQMEKFLVISPKAKAAQNEFIFLFYSGEGDGTHIEQIITAMQGGWNQALQEWDLRDGINYLVNQEGVYRYTGRFNQMFVKTTPIAYELLSFPTGNPEEFNLRQLGQYVRLLIRGGETEDAKFYAVRLYQRYFLLVIPLLFSVLGAAIGVERSRARKNMGLTYAAALLLFYNVFIPVSTTLGSIGLLPPMVAAFIPPLVAAGSGCAILKLRQFEG